MDRNQRKTDVMLIGILLSSFFITFACCDKGYVVDVLKDKRFSCAKAFKETFTVTSEIQCTNKCLRKKCRLLNYNTKKKAMHNCEVFNGQLLSARKTGKQLLFR